jgi:hypothetical protein
VRVAESKSARKTVLFEGGGGRKEGESAIHRTIVIGAPLDIHGHYLMLGCLICLLVD